MMYKRYMYKYIIIKKRKICRINKMKKILEQNHKKKGYHKWRNGTILLP